MPSIEERLRRLEDERDILRTMYAYGHAYDYGFEQEFVDLWTEDALLHYTRREPLRGREAILGFFRKHTHAPQAWHKHFLAEPRITIEGDRATVQSMYARLDRYDEGPKVRSFGRYLDIFVRCPDGRWRFKERRAEQEAKRPDSPDTVV